MLPEKRSSPLACRESFSWFSISTYWDIFFTGAEICSAGTSNIRFSSAANSIIQALPPHSMCK